MATAHCLEDIVVDADTIAQLELATARVEQLTKQLTAVMRTLAHVCPSDEHRKLYDETWAMLADLGVVPDERWEGFEKAYAEWSGKR